MALVVKNDSIQLERLSLGPYGTNCYIVTCGQTKESILVDTPAEADQILAHLKGTNPRHIVITHNHMDHLGAFKEVKSKLGIPVAVHPLDAKRLPSQPEILLDDGDMITCGKIDLKVLHTPGHTPGSICLITGNYLIS